MRKEDCKVGMNVIFGRDNGEKTTGVVVKMNPTKAKIQTTCKRGHGRGSEVGTIWGVPYSMMDAQNPSEQVEQKEETKIKFIRGSAKALKVYSFQNVEVADTVPCPCCDGTAMLIGALDDPTGELSSQDDFVCLNDSCNITIYLCNKCLKPTGHLTQAQPWEK